MQQSCSGGDHKDQLILDSRQTAWVVCALLLLLFFVFMVGYFMGKRQAVEQFSHALDQESIADKIYSSLYASYEGKTGIEFSQTDQIDKAETNTIYQANSTPVVDALQKEESSTPSTSDGTQQAQDVQEQTSAPSSLAYYAPLIGFGSQKAARAYAHRLLQRGFPVELKTRTSKTAKGRIIHWYQIITKPFTQRNELEHLIALLEKREHLTHIKIATLLV